MAKAVWLSCCLMLAGCASTYDLPELPGPDKAPQYYRPVLETEYRIQLDDELLIKSYYDSQLNQTLSVRPDGKISPVLIGEVEAVGKTTSELAEELRALYGERLDAPDITVNIGSASERRVYIGGEVSRPMVHAIHGSLTLMQAVTLSGGFKETANLEQVLLLRRNGESFTANQVDVEKVLSNEIPDVYLSKNDVVFVPRSRVANANLFVEQYITGMIPQVIRFTFGYQKLDTDDSTTTTIQTAD